MEQQLQTSKSEVSSATPSSTNIQLVSTPNNTTPVKPVSNTTPVTNTDDSMVIPAVVSKEDPSGEIKQLEEKIAAVKLPPEISEKLDKMLLRLHRMSQRGNYGGEYESIIKYVNWVVQVPFGQMTQDNLDLKNVEATLNSSHYGLGLVKEKILEYIAVLKLQNEGIFKAASQNTELNAVERTSLLTGNSANAPIILFVGVQGIGKTSITKSIANALGRKMVRIPLGALADSALIKGRPLGYPDAEPGLISKALMRSGVMNPLLLLDEIDKVSEKSGARADLMAALLEILDPEQNATFQDMYMDFPIDLSKTMIVCTANNLGGITAAVLDRLEIIRLSSYTDDEKQNIARNYILPKVRKSMGISEEQLQFSEDVWDLVIRPLGFDAGIRQLERVLANLARKVAKKIVMGEGTSFLVTRDNFRDYFPEDIGVYS